MSKENKKMGTTGGLAVTHPSPNPARAGLTSEVLSQSGGTKTRRSCESEPTQTSDNLR